MRILLTGGTGLVGCHLIPTLVDLHHEVTVLTRHPPRARAKLGQTVTLLSSLDQLRNLDDIDAVINLAGEPIADRRWSEQQKQRLCTSRWQITERLATLIKASKQPPTVFISASATGFYGNRGDTPLTEEDPGQNEFTHHLCARWEALALTAQSEQTRVCLLRTGMILARKGDALGRLKMPFYCYLGGKMGDGRQYLPWIHIDDMRDGIIWLLTHATLQGPFNMVAPQAVRNQAFAETLGRVLHRPACVPVPATVIRLLMGEASVLLLDGQRALADKLLASAFTFRWPQLEGALNDLL